MTLPSFASARGGSGDVVGADNHNVLELSDIENPESLKDHPLEIDINLQLGEKEGILPFVFDGKHAVSGAQDTSVFLEALARA